MNFCDTLKFRNFDEKAPWCCSVKKDCMSCITCTAYTSAPVNPVDENPNVIPMGHRGAAKTPQNLTPVGDARERLFALHKKLCSKGFRLMETKNQDYSGATGDPYANFEATQFLGISPIQGILMRMTDKLSRVSSFDARGELKVKDESVEDALIDIINYSVLIGGIINEKDSSA